jgi:hypothetical protein
MQQDRTVFADRLLADDELSGFEYGVNAVPAPIAGQAATTRQSVGDPRHAAELVGFLGYLADGKAPLRNNLNFFHHIATLDGWKLIT